MMKQNKHSDQLQFKLPPDLKPCSNSFPRRFAWTSFVLLHPQLLLYSCCPLLEGGFHTKIGALWW